MSTRAFAADAVNLYVGTAADAITGSMTILMKTNKYYTDGTLQRTGVSYPVTREWGRLAVESGWASDTASVLPIRDTPSLLNAAETAAVRVLVGDARIVNTVSRNISTADNGQTLIPTGTLTYTIPAGLSPMPSFTVDCPASGVISIARSGAATLNGAGITLTRARAGNPVGFVVLAHSETDSYGVSGA